MILRRGAALAGLFLVMFAAPASAHADLVSTSHVVCSYAHAGEELRLGFSQELAAGSVLIIEADGAEIARAGVDLSDIDHTQLAAMIPTFSADLLTVDYIAVSATDNDVVRESFRLAAGDGDAETCRNAAELGGGLNSIVLVAMASVALLVGLVTVARRSPLMAG